ncbi:MAG: radical SAM protein [Methylococcales bacterium]
MSNHPYEYTREIVNLYPDVSERWCQGTLVPAQVEIHLPPRSKRLCWLQCPHCYTHGGLVQGETIDANRIVALVRQIAAGSPKTGEGPRKIILSGVETDPMNSSAIHEVVAAVKTEGLALGIHTKGLKMDPALIARLVNDNTAEDYISFSIDAGDSQTYNLVHGIPQSEALLYEIVKRNVERLVAARNASGARLSIRATYLITGQNAGLDQAARFIDDFTAIGVDSLRFSVPIVPKMGQRDESGRFPQIAPDELGKIEQRLAARKQDNARIVYQKFDANTRRTLPCFTRWLMPAIGYDGYLYPVSVLHRGYSGVYGLADRRLKGAGFLGCLIIRIEICRSKRPTASAIARRWRSIATWIKSSRFGGNQAQRQEAL